MMHQIYSMHQISDNRLHQNSDSAVILAIPCVVIGENRYYSC
jgi:hypothetical protein